MENTALSNQEQRDRITESNHFDFAWQAQIFALVVSLNEKGFFTWSEWTHELVLEMNEHPEREYYAQWYYGLLNLLMKKNLISSP